ncbi:hypothetical protein HNR53_003413 [Bacillus benzoevorans]|uniref:Uncharacterized protein n=1 Tax=Bacillus benzoevorans TaxID=1456 RepID=A0A7X0HTU0_9BACI|nr:hypothetical protein [Bacillus benzoevorans]
MKIRACESMFGPVAFIDYSRYGKEAREEKLILLA